MSCDTFELSKSFHTIQATLIAWAPTQHSELENKYRIISIKFYVMQHLFLNP